MAEFVATAKQRELIDKVKHRWERCQPSHTEFERMYDKNEQAYKGILSSVSDAAKWRHQVHPPYAFNLIETIVSNTVEQGLVFDVRPSPYQNLSLEEAQQMLAQTDSVGALLAHEHRVDHFDYKQRPLFLTAAIGGRGVGKTYWNYTERSMKRQGVEEVEIHDENDNYLGTVPTIKEITEQGVYRDHSTFEVIDPRDFVVHESAKSLQPFEPGGAQYLFHRCFYSYEQLKMMEAAGFLKNVDSTVENRNASDQPNTRSQTVFQNRAKDLIEVWEYWCMEGGEVMRVIMTPFGVILRDLESNPFWHGDYPFVICSSMPQPFTTIGMSDVELIAQLQEILWEFMNQRLDNVELINNFITLIRDDVFDPEAYEFFPGARWLVQTPQDVSTLQPPYQLGEVSIHSEALIKGDLQNVTSAAPFAGGAETATVDQKTATGASIVMNAAQARMIAKKWESMKALIDESGQRIENCKQFLDEPRLAHILGKDGTLAFQSIDPIEIQGNWLVELNPESDSNLRQERRAEATQFFQVVMAAAPLMAASGQPLNIGEVFRWYGKKWDIVDVERFLSQQAPSLGAAAAPGGPGGGGGGGAPTQGPPNLGVTTASAPGTEVGASPVQALQRALQMGGGTPGIPTAGR